MFGADLLIDSGMSFSALCKEISIHNIKYLLLTHEHGDHFKTATIRKLVVNCPDLLIVCGDWMVKKMVDIGIKKEQIKVVYQGLAYRLGDWTIAPVKAYHNVQNFGYRLLLDGHKHFHITDTSTLEGINAMNYDTATIECNHCEVRIVELIDEANKEGKFTHLSGAKNSHLSVQKTISFVRENKIKKITPVHVGGSTRAEVRQALIEFMNEGK